MQIITQYRKEKQPVHSYGKKKENKFHPFIHRVMG